MDVLTNLLSVIKSFKDVIENMSPSTKILFTAALCTTDVDVAN
jgi:hypothetical protein